MELAGFKRLPFAVFLLIVGISRYFVIALKGRCNPYFVDSQGHGCKTYADMKYCRINGDYGENWNPYETFEYYAVNGEDATSCPQCGCQEIEYVDYDVNSDEVKNIYDYACTEKVIWKNGRYQVIPCDKRVLDVPRSNLRGTTRPCQPRLTLCSDINGRNYCDLARKWKSWNFNSGAWRWTIQSPSFGPDGRRNCCFEIFEHKHRSIAGRSEVIRPGTHKQIYWNIRSFKMSRENC